MANVIVPTEKPMSGVIPVEYAGFLARYLNLSTQKVVHHNIKNFLQFLAQARCPIDKVTQSILNVYLDALRKSGLSNAAYNQNVSNIKKFLEYNGKRGFEYKTARVESYGKMKLVSEQGFKNILQFLVGKKDMAEKKHGKYLRDYVLFNVLYLTGLRKAEVIGLKHENIRLEGDKVVYQAICKGGKEIKKEFPASLVNDLKSLKQLEGKGDTDFIFTSQYSKRGKRMSGRALNRILNLYYKRLNGGAETVTVHSIRNLSALKVYGITRDITRTQAHLNHANLNTTQIYLRKMQTAGIDYYREMADAMHN